MGGPNVFNVEVDQGVAIDRFRGGGNIAMNNGSATSTQYKDDLADSSIRLLELLPKGVDNSIK